MASDRPQLYIIMQHYMFIRSSPIIAADYAPLYATHYNAILFDYVANNWNTNWLTTVVRFAVNGKFFAALFTFFARFCDLFSLCYAQFSLFFVRFVTLSPTCNLSPHIINNYVTLNDN